MAVGAPVVLAKGGSLDDLAAYVFTPTKPTAGRLVVLHVFAWHPSITAEVPVSVAGLGLNTWQNFRSVLSSNSRGRWSAWRGDMAGTPVAGSLTITFNNPMGGVLWQLLEYPGVDPTTPIPQSAAATMSTTAPQVTLPSEVGSGNASAGFAGTLSGTGEDFGAGAGYTLVGAEAEQAGMSSHAIFRQAGAKLVAFTRDGTATSPKGVIGYEIKAASTTNTAPVADAGADKNVAAAALVTLTGAATDAEGGSLTYLWEQVTGPTVTLAGSGATRTFIAPRLPAATSLGFRLTVTDAGGLVDTDNMVVTVAPHKEWLRTQQGLVALRDGDVGDENPVAPNAPTNMTVSGTTNTTASLAWTASTLPPGAAPVTEYRVYVNGSQVAATASTSITLTGLTPATSYQVRVRAFNGLLSAQSSLVTATTTGTNPGPTGWRLTYDTDFPASELDNWTVRGRNGVPPQTQSNDESFNIGRNVEAGVLGNGRGLRIWGRREVYTNGGTTRQFTSGEMEGHGPGQVMPNYFRARVECSHDEDSGFWPAPLWFRPQAGGDGSNGELDVMEYFGGLFSGTSRRIAITMHNEYGATQDSIKNYLLYSQLDKQPGIVTAMRSYTLEKTPGLIKVIVDDDEDNVRLFGPAAPNGGPGSPLSGGAWTKPWWNRIMEAANRTWYPRITLQLGGNAGPIPATWQEGSMQVPRLQLWVPA